MAKRTFQTEEELKTFMDDQATKLGEIFSQCWESEDFKKKFIADPKKTFDEYGMEYDDDREYRIIDTPEKTIVQVLPYENTKLGVENLAHRLLKTVDGLENTDSKQILLEGWKWEIYQSTEDVYYLAIPVSPENLTPEELEMVNGGCIIAAIFFLFAAAAVAEAAMTATTIFVAAETAVVAVLDVAVAVLAAGVAVEAGIIATTAIVASQVVTTGNDFAKKDDDPNNPPSGGGGNNGNRHGG